MKRRAFIQSLAVFSVPTISHALVERSLSFEPELDGEIRLINYYEVMIDETVWRYDICTRRRDLDVKYLRYIQLIERNDERALRILAEDMSPTEVLLEFPHSLGAETSIHYELLPGYLLTPYR